MGEYETAQALSDAEAARLRERGFVPSGRTATCLHCDGNGVGFTLTGCPGCDGWGFVRPEQQAQQRADLETRRLLSGLSVPRSAPSDAKQGPGAVFLGLFSICLGIALYGHLLGLW
jgi:hypothetical protein